MENKPHPRAALLKQIAAEAEKSESFYRDYEYRLHEEWRRPNSVGELFSAVAAIGGTIRLNPAGYEVSGTVPRKAADEAREKKAKYGGMTLTHCERAILDLLGNDEKQRHASTSYPDVATKED